MQKHLVYFSFASFIVWLTVFSIPSTPVVFEAPKAEAADFEEMLIQLAGLQASLESASQELEKYKLAQVSLRGYEAEPETKKDSRSKPKEVRQVPFYSQFNDITAAGWKKIGCGIASLAMIIDYYGPSVAVDDLLQEGINAGAYIESAGWSHAGLIGVANKYNLAGEAVGLGHLSPEKAFAELEAVLEEGPVIASVYYTFTPGHPIPHLVTITDVNDGMVYYNDPAEPSGNGSISIADFKPAWKQRYISIVPTS